MAAGALEGPLPGLPPVVEGSASWGNGDRWYDRGDVGHTTGLT